MPYENVMHRMVISGIGHVDIACVLSGHIRRIHGMAIQDLGNNCHMPIYHKVGKHGNSQTRAIYNVICAIADTFIDGILPETNNVDEIAVNLSKVNCKNNFRDSKTTIWLWETPCHIGFFNVH